ncbi:MULTISPECIES: hypothetical protein [unclassified Archaeoglobus]|uniref:hypothetical protein n=1 Tax=unclassified Archaeoglobus TaxID=2643606 RepID=UPI0025B90914|nr:MULTISPECIES: hypothetical protein [unclassified Archaeoglobus]
MSKIEPFTMYLTDRIGRFELKTSVIFNVSYDAQEGLWCIGNEELALGGYGSSYQEALLDLESSLESLIIGFLSIPDEKLNDKSKGIKSKLLKYLDLEQLRNSYDLVLKT